MSIYTHGEPGSMLRGLKDSAVAAAALNGKETRETIDLAPALNWKGIPRQSSGLGVGACCSPLPSISAEGDTKSRDKGANSCQNVNFFKFWCRVLSRQLLLC